MSTHQTRIKATENPKCPENSKDTSGGRPNFRGQEVNAIQFGGLIKRDEPQGKEFSGLIKDVKIYGLGKYKDVPNVHGKVIPLSCEKKNLEENLKPIFTNNA